MGYEVMPWVFSATVFTNLKKVNSEWPLEQHDVKVTCTVKKGMATYDFTPCKQTIWQSNEKIKKAALEQFPALMEEAKGNLASDMSTEEIKELLGLDSPGSEDAAVNINMDDVVGDI